MSIVFITLAQNKWCIYKRTYKLRLPQWKNLIMWTAQSSANVPKEGSFNEQSFAEGRFRRAFKGVWISHPERGGKQVVIKEMKDIFMWEPTNWDTTLKIYSTAADLANKFNSSVRPARVITYVDVEKAIITQRSTPMATPRVNEYVVVEDYLPGDFTKWCNNFGYISQSAMGVHNLLPAFMHWTWAYTRGEMMVADLQGVFDDGRYRLTDPVIMSLDAKFGATDTSVEGILGFFLAHRCTNVACGGLPKPKLRDFARVIPDQDMKEFQQKLRKFFTSSTTYRQEINVLPSFRSKVQEVLRQIAQRQ